MPETQPEKNDGDGDKYPFIWFEQGQTADPCTADAERDEHKGREAAGGG